MTNPYPFVKSCRVAQLASELDAQFGSKVKTVRARSAGVDGMCVSGEVQHDGTLSDASVQAVIDAHAPAQTEYQKLRAPAVSAAISRLEAGTATPLEVQTYLARVLRYLRQEAT